MNEAFVDFTGGIGETIPLKVPNPELLDKIKELLQKGSMMAAGTQVSARKPHFLRAKLGKKPASHLEGDGTSPPQ